VTARLQRDCPDLFSSFDATSLRGWELLSRAAAAATAEANRAPLLTDALATFAPVAATDPTLDLAALLDAFFGHHAHAHRGASAAAAPLRSPATAAAERALAELPLAAARAADPEDLATAALSPGGAAGGLDGWSRRQVKRSTGHIHTHTPTETNTPDTDTHAHDKNTPNPQTNTSHKHLTTLEGSAAGGLDGWSRRQVIPFFLTQTQTHPLHPFLSNANAPLTYRSLV